MSHLNIAFSSQYISPGHHHLPTRLQAYLIYGILSRISIVPNNQDLSITAGGWFAQSAHPKMRLS